VQETSLTSLPGAIGVIKFAQAEQTLATTAHARTVGMTIWCYSQDDDFPNDLKVLCSIFVRRGMTPWCYTRGNRPWKWQIFVFFQVFVRDWSG